MLVLDQLREWQEVLENALEEGAEDKFQLHLRFLASCYAELVGNITVVPATWKRSSRKSRDRW